MVNLTELYELVKRISDEENADDEEMERLAELAEETGSYYAYDSARFDRWERGTERLGELLHVLRSGLGVS